MKSPVFYSLTIQDLQNVAEETLDRELTEEEIHRIITLVEQRMPWYDVIEDAINEVITGEKHE